jgi:hypothetical protein
MCQDHWDVCSCDFLMPQQQPGFPKTKPFSGPRDTFPMCAFFLLTLTWLLSLELSSYQSCPHIFECVLAGESDHVDCNPAYPPILSFPHESQASFASTALPTFSWLPSGIVTSVLMNKVTVRGNHCFSFYGFFLDSKKSVVIWLVSLSPPFMNTYMRELVKWI